MCENLASWKTRTGLWTGVDFFQRGIFFGGGEGGGEGVLFFLLCKKKSRFQPTPNGYISSFGGGGGGSIIYTLLFFVVCWFCFMSVIFSLGGGLRLVALFDSRPSRFT